MYKLRELFKDLHMGNMSKYFSGEYEEKMVEQKLAILKLPTGRIVANDPLCLYEFEPFQITVEPGEYPVYLFLHHIEDDKRVAFAEIRFTDKKPVTYELAQKVLSEDMVDEEDYHCYGVDSGTGGFMDESVLDVVKEYDTKEGDKYFNDINLLLEKSYVHTYDTADYTPKGAEANVVVFSSGYGDGGYSSYWGYDEDGKICCLMTDFETIDLLEEEAEEEMEDNPEKVSFLKKCANKILGK